MKKESRSYLLSHPFPQQTCGAENEDKDEHKEGYGILPRDGHVGCAHGFEHAEQDAPHHRAGDVAYPSQTTNLYGFLPGSTTSSSSPSKNLLR